MGVRAFDNSRRDVIGEVNIDLVIWPTTLTIPLQVLDIQSSFNLVLGRPWLHDTGVVPSTLHQRMIFVLGNLVISILGEPEIIMPSNGEGADAALQVPVIDIKHSAEDVQYHSLKFETVNLIPSDTPGG
jgi:hypothetical protein